jgi:hypothetical protein
LYVFIGGVNIKKAQGTGFKVQGKVRGEKPARPLAAIAPGLIEYESAMKFNGRAFGALPLLSCEEFASCFLLFYYDISKIG